MQLEDYFDFFARDDIRLKRFFTGDKQPHFFE